MKKVLLAITILVLAFASNAQTKQDPWSIGIHAGSEQYNGELENQFFDFTDSHNGFAGISASRYISPHFNVSLDLTLGDIKFRNSEELSESFDYNMNQANIHLKYNFFNYNDVKFRPFVFAGIGMIVFDGRNRDESNLSIPSAGAGLNYKLNDRVSIRYQNTLLVSNYDELDNRTGGGNDMYLQTSLGISAVIKSSSDLDRDGVVDKNDKCPDTDLGMKVDKDGCAIDLDLDGVINSEDRCPSIAGFAHTKGCPDMDNDSIADMDDPCPEIAGPLNGCPDSDGDQVADKDDKCPNTPGLVTLSGCPEEMVEAEAKRIGIFEYNELPMENAALVVLDENGNPVDTIYTDGEGKFKFTQLMADKNYSLRPIDLEGDPNDVDIYLTDDDGNRRDTRNKGNDTFVFTPATDADDKPYTEVDDSQMADESSDDKKEQKAQSSDIPLELLTDIKFESESFTIKIKYYDQLNRLAAVLRKQADVNIELIGYADSTGPEDYNQRLTDQRADRVKRYLVKKGIPASRVKEVGKGEENPIATNLSKEGRAENRRVEIKLMD